MATSHHGQAASDESEQETYKRLLSQLESTSRRAYPRGRMGAEDDGALSYAIASDKDAGTVVIRFGKPVEWIGLAPADVERLIQALIEHTREVATEPFSLLIPR